MHIVADANLALLEETFGRHATITRLPGREISAEHLVNADALLLRSVTRANREILDGSAVKFVGTATIGTDHLDIPYLEDRGIHWTSAPGCNANAAAQYSLAMAWLACERRGKDLRDLTVGIIGKGNVGSRLQGLLNVLQIPSVACDPPLADKGETGLVDLATALQQAVISLHVPLTRDGPYPTFQMLGRHQLSGLADGTILVNSSRGNVLVGTALLDAIGQGRISAALDVWPDEPQLSLPLLDCAVVATPHVAGYSLQGKQNGTLMIYHAFCQWAGIEPDAVSGATGVLSKLELELEMGVDPVSQLLASSCGVDGDDLTMRSALAAPDCDIAPTFDQLRKSYRLRNDFDAWEVSGASAKRLRLLREMGALTAE
jgi:erythronate-4-phosphate dehydrogenase